jgi:hypothetical protein
LTFAVQPGVPSGATNRTYVLRRLLEYAHKYPERRVLVKLRARADERTTHEEPFHYEKLFEELGVERPANLQFVYGKMAAVLDMTDVLVTVSSTAAIESIARGIPTVVLRDFGVKELLGNHFFAGSGCLASFDEILRDELPVVDAEWRAHNGLGDDDDMGAVAARVQELLDAERERGAMLPFEAMYYTPDSAPAAYEELRARWSTGAAPEFDLGITPAVRRFVRQVLRGPLYKRYRQLARWAGV